MLIKSITTLHKGRSQMKKIVLLLCLGLVLLTACQKTEVKETPKKKACAVNEKKTEQTTSTNTTYPYPQLLPTKNGYYSLLIIDKSEEKSPIEGDKKVLDRVHEILSLSLEQATKVYPKLQIKKDPTYILFDKNGVAHQSTTPKDLLDFLETNKAE
jgi:hypothetical protein